MLKGGDAGIQAAKRNTIRFAEFFSRMAGFEPKPAWFGYHDWDEFAPVFERARGEGTAFDRRQRFLTSALARYAWLNFNSSCADIALRHAPLAGKGFLPGVPALRFSVCSATGSPLDAADPRLRAGTQRHRWSLLSPPLCGRATLFR